MPPCGGDGQQGGLRTNPTAISRLLQQPLLGAKKSGGLRPVINLKPLKLFLKKEKFKMETTRSIRKALSTGNWVTSIDLKDEYFHVPVHPNFRKYLRVGGKVSQFRALPFGLSPALREFCRVTGVLGTLFPKLTIYLHLYLDDWLLRATPRAICLAYTQIALEKAQNLGFLVNWAKSELIPTPRFVFLREAYDLVAGLVRPSKEAVAKVLTLCRVLSRQPLQTSHFLHRLLGVLNSVAVVEMETTRSIRKALSPGDWVTSIDLKTHISRFR